MILGNLDQDIREFLKPGIALSIPFFAFSLGAGLSLKSIVVAGFSGLLLGVLTLVVTGLGGYFVYKLLVPKKDRISAAVGAAVASTAGNAVGTPAAIAMIDPTWQFAVSSATVQISASVVITAILCPFLVDFLYKLETKNK